MCILQACEKPTEQGVWWRDDTEWRLYSAHHQALVQNGIADQLQKLELGTIVSGVHPLGAKYTLNLRKMEQIAVSSGQRRPVMVVDGAKRKPRAATLLPKMSFKELPLHLHYKSNDGNLKRYNPIVEKAVLRSMKACGPRTIVLRGIVPDSALKKSAQLPLPKKLWTEAY